MSIIDIFLLILIIVAIIVGIYLIVSLKKINVTLDLVQEDLSNISSKLEPILDNVNVITEKAANISNETEKRVLDISNTIQNVKSTISSLSFKSAGRSSERNPIQELLLNVNAISKGVLVFWKKLKN